MQIGGFLKQSFIDYPGKIASVIFTSGCNFRCFYCHNPELVLPELIEQNPKIDYDDILDYLNKNKNLLDAVVISGGEPTLHKGLTEFVREVKKLDLQVKLDTNGTNPKLLNNLIKNKLVDYVAMDIKTELSTQKYQQIVGDDFFFIQMDRVLESIHLTQSSDIEYEFRTTLVYPNHAKQDVLKIAEQIKGNYYLQTLQKDKTLQRIENKSSFSESDLEYLLKNNSTEVNIRIRT